MSVWFLWSGGASAVDGVNAVLSIWTSYGAWVHYMSGVEVIPPLLFRTALKHDCMLKVWFNVGLCGNRCNWFVIHSQSAVMLSFKANQILLLVWLISLIIYMGFDSLSFNWIKKAVCVELNYHFSRFCWPAVLKCVTQCVLLCFILEGIYSCWRQVMSVQLFSW